MKKINLLFLTMFFFVATNSQTYVPHHNDTRFIKHEVVDIKAYSFPLEYVKVLGGPFKNASEKGMDWLLYLEPDRFLHRFHENAGLPTKAEQYNGWEASSQSGFNFGHWLSASSMAYAANKDSEDPTVRANALRLLNKIQYSIQELKKCQDARGTGYVGAIAPGWDSDPNLKEDVLWDQLASGVFNRNGTNHWLNGCWVPWYSTHKVWAGLLDVYLYTGNTTAKDIVIKLADWASEKFKNLTPEQWEYMLYTEFGGMNEVMHNIYAISGDPKHLELAKKFYHKMVLDPLAAQVDKLNGLHANTQIPKITGAARSYELTGTSSDQTIASFFWNTVVHDHSYCTGGNSHSEHFGLPRQLTLSRQTTETCNTYNMLKLTRHLFSWNPTAEYMDYYERALYNHILASQNPETGMICYLVPLSANSNKSFSSRDGDFWCCVGTGFENHVKYGEQIYSHGTNSLYVNLFVDSELNWKEKGLKVRQITDFPDSEKSEFIISTTTPQNLTVFLRYPSWATSNYKILVNGQALELGENTPGSYVEVSRTWSDGDKIEIQFPKTLYTELLLGDEHKTAILNGPLVMAADMQVGQDVPVFLNEGNSLESWIQPGANENEFSTIGGLPTDVKLMPFYKKYQGNYSVYFDMFSPEEWTTVKEEYEAALEYQKLLDKITLDEFFANEQQSEVEHKFTGQNVNKGVGELGKKWVDARGGGWMSFEMKVDPNLPNELRLTHWGSDGGDRRFDILADGEVFSYDHVDNFKPNVYYDMSHAIPYHITKGKSKVTIKLQARPGNMVGGVFGARMVLKKEMIENVTVQDFLLPKQPYLNEHNYTSNGETGTHKEHPWADGYGQTGLSFDIKCSPTNENFLLLSYWGGEWDLRSYDILVERQVIGHQELQNNKPGEFFDVLHSIPLELTKDKSKVRVHFKGSNTKVGGIYYAYLFSKQTGTGLEQVDNLRNILSIKTYDSYLILKNLTSNPLNGTLNIIAMDGKCAYLGDISINNDTKLSASFEKGAYVVSFITDDKTHSYSTKIII